MLKVLYKNGSIAYFKDTPNMRAALKRCNLVRRVLTSNGEVF